MFIDTVIYLLTGVFAGTFGSLLGLGGGLVLIPLLRFVFDLPPEIAAGTSIFAVLFTTLSGSAKHYKLKHFKIDYIIPIVVSGLIGSSLFSLLFKYIAFKKGALDLVIGVTMSLLSVSLIYFVFRPLKNSPEDDPYKEPFLLRKISIGFGTGFLPGLVGLGGGSIMVPLFHLLLKLPIKNAIGSAMPCYMLSALISSVFKISQGYISLPVAIPIALGTFTGGYIGATLTAKSHSKVLKLLLACVIIFIAIKFIISGLGT